MKMSNHKKYSYKPENLRVLILDDHDLMRKSLTKILRKNKFLHTTECSNAQDAIKIFQSQIIDLILCDLYMSKGDGLEFLESIRNHQTNADVPFIAITGEASKEEIVRAADKGADDYVIKPFQPEEIERKIKSILTKYHSPSPLLAELRKAERHLLKKEFTKATDAIQSALKQDPNSSRANHLKALIFDATGRSFEAEKLLKANIEANAKFLLNYRTLADIYHREGEIDHCIDAMINELQINPKQPKRQVMLAKLLMKKGNNSLAIAHFRQSLLENGKYSPALFGMGKAYAQCENLEKSVYYFKRLRRHYPSSTKALEAIVRYCLEADAPRTAEICLRNEKKSFPKRLDTYIVLAKLYAALHQYPKAIDVIDEALNVEPQFIEALRIRAAIAYKTEDMKLAISTYKDILKIKIDPTTLLNLAEILITTKNFNEAAKYLEKSFQVKGDTVRITFWLAEINKETGQYVKALYLYQRLLLLGYQDPNIPKLMKEIRKNLRKRRDKVRFSSSAAS